MKNKFKTSLILTIFFFLFSTAYSLELNIQAQNITVDKNKNLTSLSGSVKASDDKNNILTSDKAIYKKENGVFQSLGETSVTTSEGYELIGKNIYFDNKKKIIWSNEKSILKDLSNNKITMNKFEYSTEKNFFKSVDEVKVIDQNKNEYIFSQIYIDEKKREIIGTDIKAFFNDDSLKSNPKNKPRYFANTIYIDNNQSTFEKGIFTVCDYRENDKCPPWSIQAGKINHNSSKKTVYYDNAILKIYDVPIFYFPKLSHPDPTVKRRSGFLIPYLTDSKNLGLGVRTPYFLALSKDKDITFSPSLYASENPLLNAEYRQIFSDSSLKIDAGYTDGYKNTTVKKKAGSKSHVFAKFIKSFKDSIKKNKKLIVQLQRTNNQKYLKLYKLKSDLVDYETNKLENFLDYTVEDDKSFFGLRATVYESLIDTSKDKFEYIAPDIIYDKNLFVSEDYGILDYRLNLKYHNYDTNKESSFFVNDFDWKSNNNYLFNNVESYFKTKVRNINYVSNNVENLKNNEDNFEIMAALGYYGELKLQNKNNKINQFLTPKFLVRYSPGSMRKSEDNNKLSYLDVFSLDRLSGGYNLETGFSTSIGFEYELKSKETEFDLNIGQVINEKENRNKGSKSSLDQRFSDIVGESNLKMNQNVELKYNFSLDQNYQVFNYNELGVKFDYDPIKINFSFIQEQNHIGNQEYIVSGFEVKAGERAKFSFENKRNLLTDASEFYDLSYEYINDCLRAGLVYRREFYDDSELEPENSLMFKITIVPFGDISSPSFNR